MGLREQLVAAERDLAALREDEFQARTVLNERDDMLEENRALRALLARGEQHADIFSRPAVVWRDDVRAFLDGRPEEKP